MQDEPPCYIDSIRRYSADAHLKMSFNKLEVARGIDKRIKRCKKQVASCKLYFDHTFVIKYRNNKISELNKETLRENLQVKAKSK